MSATTNNISVEQNVPYSLTITLYASDGTTPVNVLNNYYFSCEIRADYQSPALASLSLGSGISVGGTNSNVVTISFSAAQTLSLPVTTASSSLVYDVYLLPISGSANACLARGSVSVVGAISRT